MSRSVSLKSSKTNVLNVRLADETFFVKLATKRLVLDATTKIVRLAEQNLPVLVEHTFCFDCTSASFNVRAIFYSRTLVTPYAPLSANYSALPF